jgi:hypothetical protein
VIGVLVESSKVDVVDNCDTIDTNGRCATACGGGNLMSIVGALTAIDTGETYPVLLSSSPGSVIARNAMCQNNALDGAGVRVEGMAKGVIVRDNYINALGGLRNSHGVWVEDCNDDAPWIVDNFSIYTTGRVTNSSADGVHAVGACHPVIDSNLLISGGGEGNASNVNGVYCGANTAGVVSRCVVLNNQRIQGSSSGFPPTAVGVDCEAGGCMRIAGNRLITGNAAATATIGVRLGKTGTLVDGNVISGGCAGQSTGVFASDSYARLQNNWISAGCETPLATATYVGLSTISSGTNVLDVESNDLDGLPGVVEVASAAGRA